MIDAAFIWSVDLSVLALFDLSAFLWEYRVATTVPTRLRPDRPGFGNIQTEQAGGNSPLGMVLRLRGKPVVRHRHVLLFDRTSGLCLPSALTLKQMDRPMGTTQYRAALLLLLMVPSATGCTPGWRAYKPGRGPVNVQPPERQIIEFRVDSQLIRLHAVKFTRDSVSGIPWLKHTSCDSCRVGYALSGVSEMRTGCPGRPAWIIAIPFFTLIGLGVLFALACGNCLE